jgi:hypothetical protein
VLEDTEMGATWMARLSYVTAVPNVGRAAVERGAPRVAGTVARWFDRQRPHEAGASAQGASAPARLDWTSSTARHFPPR